MRIYIAGPITTDKEHYKEHFSAAEDYWKTKGYEVINPALNEYDEEASAAGHADKWTPEAWLFYIKRDMDLVASCDAIYLLKGWEQSPGANVELITAKKFGLEIIYE